MNLRTLAAALSVVAPTAVARDDQFLRGLAKPGTIDDSCAFSGNGFPKGKGIQPIFRFKLLGRDVSNGQTWNFDPNGQNSIAVKLNGKSKILLENSDVVGNCPTCEGGFCIPDPNGTDGEATMCMKDPFPIYDNPCIDGTEPSCDEKAIFRIFARVRGKGSLTMTACVEVDGSDWCDMGGVELSTKRATDISQDLLTICYQGAGIGLFDEICVNSDGDLVSCNDPDAIQTDEQYFWEVDNNGVRNAEFRFYDQGELDSLYAGTGCLWEDVTRGNACPK